MSNNRMLIYTIIKFFLSPLLLLGQEDISIGARKHLYSECLGEEREFWIHLPDGYEHGTEDYPVIYLLDGASFFHVIVGFCETFATIKGNKIPPCIVVGVLSTDRTRDFTPTASSAGRDGQIDPGLLPRGGSSEVFNRFLTSELRSIIDSTYRTSGRNILIGHSYAGLFAVNTFLYHPEAFESYIAIDPSLWWDQGRLAKESASIVKGEDYAGKSLYIGVATKIRTDRVDIHRSIIEKFLSTLSEAVNLRLFYKFFPEENHGTVTIPGMYDGIKQICNK